MSDFVLVDLYGQRKAVLQFIKDMSEGEVLAWMSQYGYVRHIPMPYDAKAYSFISSSGAKSAFRFDENGNIYIYFRS